MLNKILLTLLVAAIVIAFIRLRNRGKQAPSLPPLASPYLPPPPPRRLYPLLAGAVALGVLTVGVWRLWAHWSDSLQVMVIEVVNTHSGGTQSYRAHKGDLALGGRAFRTLDGRYITLSEVDRLVIREE